MAAYTSSILTPQPLYTPTISIYRTHLLPRTPILTSTTKFPKFRVSNSFSSHPSNPVLHSRTNGIEGSDYESDESMVAKSAKEKKISTSLSLRSLMQAYRKAILDGDGEVISQFEDMIFMIEKRKKELALEVSSLPSEISSGKENYVRLQADFDNYRKKWEREQSTVRSDAHVEVIESLLPMVDNFESAKQQLKPETEKEKKIDTSYQGIYRQFVETMRSLGVGVVPTVGKPFDPSVHEAIAREESHQFKGGIVMQEFRRGFLLGDRVLRPAKVKVSSGPGKKKPPTEQR